MCLREAPLLSFLMGFHFFASYLAISLSFPMMAFEVEDRNIAPAMVGVIMSTVYIPTLILGFCLNRIAHHQGRRCVYLSGLYLFSAITFIFGFLEFIPAKGPFISISIFLRLLIGLGTFFAKTILPPIMSKRFPKNMVFMFTYQYLFMSLALGFGPALGELLYRPLRDMFWPHLLIVVIISAIFLPSGHWMLDYKKRDEEVKIVATVPSSNDPNDPGPPLRRQRIRRLLTNFEETFPFCKLFRHKRALSLSLMLFINIACQVFYSSSLAEELKEKDKSSFYIAIAYIIRPLCAAIFSSLVLPVAHKFGGILCIFFGSLFHLVSFIFIGPSHFFMMPNNPDLIILGLAFKGVADPFIYIPIIPEIVAALLRKYRPTYTIGPISDVAVSFANFLIDLASVLATILGYLTYKQVGFRITSDVMLFAQFPFLVIFMCFSGLRKHLRHCGKVEEEDRITMLNAEIAQTERELQEKEKSRKEEEKKEQPDDDFATQSFAEGDYEMQDRERELEIRNRPESFHQENLKDLSQNPPQTPPGSDLSK